MSSKISNNAIILNHKSCQKHYLYIRLTVFSQNYFPCQLCPGVHTVSSEEHGEVVLPLALVGVILYELAVVVEVAHGHVTGVSRHVDQLAVLLGEHVPWHQLEVRVCVEDAGRRLGLREEQEGKKTP